MSRAIIISLRMKKIILTFSVLAISVSMFAVVGTAFAQIIGNQGGSVQGGLNTVGPAFPVGSSTESFANVIRVVITWALYFAAVIAVLAIIYGGYLYLFSAGDATQAKKGRTVLINAIIGLVIAVMAYVIVQVVYNTLLRL